MIQQTVACTEISAFVTTKMNPNRHMKNTIDCGRQKLSDS
jgi:hypothetical protein